MEPFPLLPNDAASLADVDYTVEMAAADGILVRYDCRAVDAGRLVGNCPHCYKVGFIRMIAWIVKMRCRFSCRVKGRWVIICARRWWFI